MSLNAVMLAFNGLCILHSLDYNDGSCLTSVPPPHASYLCNKGGLCDMLYVQQDDLTYTIHHWPLMLGVGRASHTTKSQ